MSDQPWTIDSIAHALPAADTRQTFLREVNLAPLPDLPAVLARWQRLVERLEASKPALDELLQFAKDHNGELPPKYADDGRADEWFAQLGESLQRKGSNAA